MGEAGGSGQRVDKDTLREREGQQRGTVARLGRIQGNEVSIVKPKQESKRKGDENSKKNIMCCVFLSFKYCDHLKIQFLHLERSIKKQQRREDAEVLRSREDEVSSGETEG